MLNRISITFLLIGTCCNALGQTLINGSFESPVVPCPPYYLYVPSQASITSWTLTGTGTGEQTYISNFAAPGSPYPGKGSGTNSIPSLSGNQSLRLSYGDTISQIISNCVPGIPLSLKFSGTLVNVSGILRVSFGAYSNDFTASGLNALLVIPQDTNVLLSFSAICPAYDNSKEGIILDSISLTAFTSTPASLSIATYPGISIVGVVGANYLLEYADALQPTNWVALTNLTLSFSPYLFVDTSVPNGQSRFYRAISQ